MFSIIGVIVVLAGVFGGFIMAGGNVLTLVQPSEFLTLGGAAGGGMLICPPQYVLAALAKKFGKIFGAGMSSGDFLDILVMQYELYNKVRKDIAAVKATMPTVLHDIAWRAMQVHGALGVTNEMPLFKMVHGAAAMGLVDGPTEVHKTTVAKQVLRNYEPFDDQWPSSWIPRKREAAQAKYAQFLELEVGNL